MKHRILAALLTTFAITLSLPSHADDSPVKINILEPKNGATVPTTFTVKFNTVGVDIVPVGVATPENKATDNHTTDHHEHAGMDHSNIDHSNVDHSNLDHSKMDHSNMDHTNTDKSSDHSHHDHSGHPHIGHIHLLTDVDVLPNPDSPMPMNANFIHLMLGQTETQLTLLPGKHTLQLVLGNSSHMVGAAPLVSQKITVIVK